MKKTLLFLVCFALTLMPVMTFSKTGMEGQEISVHPPDVPIDTNKGLLRNDEAPTIKFPTTDLLQFRAGNHIIAFRHDRICLVSMTGSINVEFIGSNKVTPKVTEVRQEKTAERGNGLQPLGAVEYQDLWEGITLKYEGVEGGIAESTYIITPGADVGKIRLKYNAKVEIQADGSLKIKPFIKKGWMTESGPVAWQEIGGKRKPVEVAFCIKDGCVGFRVGEHDRAFTLIIDPVYQWHTFYGSAEDDIGWCIALDGSGNVYVTGSSCATWNGDAGQLPIHAHSGGYSDSFIMKLDANGAYQWHTFYGSGGSVSYEVVAGGSNNIYVIGFSGSTWNGDAGQPPIHAHSGGSGNIFVLKLNANGVYQWHTFYGSGNLEIAEGIAVDKSNNVYAMGYSGATWNGDAGQLPIHGFIGPWDIFVLKLDTNGGYQWHTFYGSGGYDYGYDIAVDGSSNAYVTGYSDTTWNGDAGQLPIHAHSGNWDIFALKLNTNGGYQWHTFYGSNLYDYGHEIAVDGAANVYVTGYSYATWDGDAAQPPIHAFSGEDDIYVLKLDTSGGYQWHTFYGSGAYDYGQGIAVDGASNVFVTGHSSATWNGDAGQLPAHAHSGRVDILVLKLDTNGGYQWHTFYGAGAIDMFSAEYAFSIAVDESGNLYVTGRTHDTWDGGPGKLPIHAYTDKDDIFVLKLSGQQVEADISVSKDDNPDIVYVNQLFTYTITVTNNGPETATGVTVTDTLPAEVTFVSVTTTKGTCTESGGIVTCDIGDMNNGEEVTVTIEVTAPGTQRTVTNTVTVTTTSSDPDASNNTDKEDTKILLFVIDPVPDIKANYLDGPVSISRWTPLRITVGLRQGSYAGVLADWWLVADTPFGWYYYAFLSGAWYSGLSVTYQGPIVNVNSLNVLNTRLPVGSYTFYFGIDTNMNGTIDYDQLFLDTVNVTIY